MKKPVLVVLSVFVLAGCRQVPSPDHTPVPAATSTPFLPTVTPPAVLNEVIVEDYFELASDAFSDGSVIPTRYTCHGEDLSPPLHWGSPPEGTEALLLLMEDPDAQQVVGFTWVHWVLYDLPPDLRALDEGIRDEPEVAGGRQGVNSWGRIGYGGACPPAGQQHHYIFTLYALDAPLGLEAGAAIDAVKAAIAGHVIATTQFVGSYP